MLQYPPLNPVALQLGPLKIHWYGVMYGLGFILTYLIVRNQARRRQLMSDSDVADFIMYLILGVILGGRLGYILFYNLPQYLSHPLEIFAVWNGGMSFHGGLIGPLVAGWIYCRKHRLNFLEMADIVMIAAPLGLGLGRLGNFINAELWGRPTDVPWAMVFPTDPLQLPRHPSQLYEFGLEGVLLFAIMVGLSRLRLPNGVLLGTFLAGYGLSRIFVELFRNPDAHLGFVLGPLSMGQVLSLPMVILGVGLIAWVMVRDRRAPAADTPSEGTISPQA